jgi:hypothetical protein
VSASAKSDQSLARGILGRLASGGEYNGVRYNGSEALRVPSELRLLGSSVKVEKGSKIGVSTAILYLAPADSAPITRNGRTVNLCPWASSGCRAGCRGEQAGRMVQSGVRNSRVWKTALFFADRALFGRILEREIAALRKRAKRQGMPLAVRLDGTSDLGLAELFGFPERFPDVILYDYTKSPHRVAIAAPTRNRHYTYSASERPESRRVAERALVHGHSVAAIVDRMPQSAKEWASLQSQVTEADRVIPTTVLDGDDTDARFLDVSAGRGALVALSVKGGQRVRKLLGRMVFPV